MGAHEPFVPSKYSSRANSQCMHVMRQLRRPTAQFVDLTGQEVARRICPDHALYCIDAGRPQYTCVDVNETNIRSGHVLQRDSVGNTTRNDACNVPNSTLSFIRRASRQDQRSSAESWVARGIDKELLKPGFIRHRSQSAQYSGLYKRERCLTYVWYMSKLEAEGISQEPYYLTIANRSGSNRNAASRSKHCCCCQYRNVHWRPRPLRLR